VLDELVEFIERVFVEKQFDPFTGSEFALAVTAFAAFGSASFFRGGVATPKFFQAIHDPRIILRV
jgi:hypothetical protein